VALTAAPISPDAVKARKALRLCWSSWALRVRRYPPAEPSATSVICWPKDASFVVILISLLIWIQHPLIVSVSACWTKWATLSKISSDLNFDFLSIWFILGRALLILIACSTRIAFRVPPALFPMCQRVILCDIGPAATRAKILFFFWRTCENFISHLSKMKACELNLSCTHMIQMAFHVI